MIHVDVFLCPFFFVFLLCSRNWTKTWMKWRPVLRSWIRNTTRWRTGRTSCRVRESKSDSPNRPHLLTTSWLTKPVTGRAVWRKSPAATDLKASLHILHIHVLFQPLQSVRDSPQRRCIVRGLHVSCSSSHSRLTHVFLYALNLEDPYFHSKLEFWSRHHVSYKNKWNEWEYPMTAWCRYQGSSKIEPAWNLSFGHFIAV